MLGGLKVHHLFARAEEHLDRPSPPEARDDRGAHHAVSFTRVIAAAAMALVAWLTLVYIHFAAQPGSRLRSTRALSLATWVSILHGVVALVGVQHLSELEELETLTIVRVCYRDPNGSHSEKEKPLDC